MHRNRTAGQGNPQEGAFLRVDALPISDGGGIVFPNGPFGRGFRLDEWAFIRYCGDQAEALRLEAEKSRTREAIAFFSALGLFIAILVSVDLLQEFDLKLWIDIADMAPAYTVFMLGAFGMVLHRRFIRKNASLAADYRGAEPLAYFKYWTARVMLAAVCGGRWWLWKHANVSFFLLYGAYLLLDQHLESGTAIAYAYVVLGLAMVEGGFLLALIFTYWHLWFRLGRAPTKDDLTPLHP